MKHIRVLSVFTMITFLLASAHSVDAQQAFAKLGTPLPSGHPSLKTLTHFQNSLDEYLAIQIFPDAQLGSAQQIMEGLQFDDIEMGILPLESLSRRAPALALLGLPYLFRNDSHRAQVLNGPLGKRFLGTLYELNLVGLGFLETGSRYYLSKDVPLDRMDRFQNRSIAILCPLSENECHPPMYAADVQSLALMGALPSVLSLDAFQESLETEKPDSLEYLPFIGLESRLKGREFKTLTLPAHRTMPSVFVASKRWFDALPPQTQQAIVRTSNSLVRQQKRVLEEALQREYAALQALGIERAEEESEEGLYESMQTLYQENSEAFDREFGPLLQAIQKIGKHMQE